MKARMALATTIVLLLTVSYLAFRWDDNHLEAYTHRKPFRVEFFPIAEPPKFGSWEGLLIKLKGRGNPDSKATHATRVHAALFWGCQQAPLPDDAKSFVSTCLQHKVFTDVVGGPPILVRTRNGATFVDSSSITGGRLKSLASSRDAHWGQTISVLAELGVPFEERAEDSQGNEFTLELIVRDLVANYALAGEIEWATIAIVLYGPKRGVWKNRFGDEFTVESAANHLLANKPGFGPCMGTHALYCLSIIRQIVDPEIVSDRLRSAINMRFIEVARCLAATQHADGSWTETWAGGQFAPLYPSASQAMWITGHHLEWIAQVPSDIRPPELNIKNAYSFVLNSLDKTDSESIWMDACIYIHGARAAFRLSGMTFQDFQTITKGGSAK